MRLESGCGSRAITRDTTQPHAPLRPYAVAGLRILLVGFAAWILHRELMQYHYADLAREIGELPAGPILLAAGLTALNYLVMTGHDGLALHYVGHPLPYRRVAFASFTGYAVSSSLGFPLLTGAPLRYRLYSSWGVPGVEIARVVTFYSVTFWLGLLAVGGVAFLVDPLPVPDFLGLPRDGLKSIGLLMLLLLAAYLASSLAHRREFRVRGLRLSVPRPRLALAQVLLSSVDWLLSAAVLYVLLPPGTVSYPVLVGIYMLAQIAGLISHVPGGVGVFDSVVLLLLKPSLAAPEIVGILLVFRVVYYLLPLVVAGLGLAIHEGRRLGPRLAPVRPVAAWAASLVPHVMAGLVFLGGVVLLFSGATPAAHTRLAWLDRVLPLAVIEASHLLASVAGVGLLLLARGLQLRLNAALHLAVILLAGGIALSLGKGLDYEEATVLALVLAGLLLSRREFYRPAALLSERFTPGWIAAVLVVLGATAWLGFFSYRHVGYATELWWRFEPTADAPRFLRATVAVVVVAAAVGIARLLRPARPEPGLPEAAELERAAAIAGHSPRSLAQLALVGDKTLLFGDDGESFLMYGTWKRSWIAMGDPVGSPAARRELAWRFAELCDTHAAWPVFHQVAPEALPMYLDMGLTLSKLGEEGRVPLARFGLEGGARKGLRQTIRRVEREGGAFEVVPPESVPALLPALRVVSDAWLATRKGAEKGFSLGYFDEAYLARFPMALVRVGDRIVAFANLWQAAPGTELSLDLMRHVDDAPDGTMEYLFVKLMLWGRERDWAWFNLGMAPLSGIEARREAPIWNRLGHLLYRHGEHFYNFQGLRGYKEKFDPVWEPRYLASPGGLALPLVLTHLSALVSGGLRRVVSR